MTKNMLNLPAKTCKYQINTKTTFEPVVLLPANKLPVQSQYHVRVGRWRAACRHTSSSGSRPGSCRPSSRTAVVKAEIRILRQDPKLFWGIRIGTFFPVGCGSGSGIRYLFDLWIRDPGWLKISGSGSGMNNPDHIFESLEPIFLG
jgi:hypothetical protein